MQELPVAVVLAGGDEVRAASSLQVTASGTRRVQVTVIVLPPAVPERASSWALSSDFILFKKQVCTELFNSFLVIKLNGSKTRSKLLHRGQE